MNQLVGHGRRLVARVVLLQVTCAVLVASLFWVLWSGSAAAAALAGGLITAIGSALFGWRMFAPGIAAARVLQRALYAAEALKWFWYVLAVWAAFARFKLLPLPLLTGLIVAQFGLWLGVLRFGSIGMKQG